jgi:hypothetical protein
MSQEPSAICERAELWVHKNSTLGLVTMPGPLP